MLFKPWQLPAELNYVAGHRGQRVKVAPLLAGAGAVTACCTVPGCCSALIPVAL